MPIATSRLGKVKVGLIGALLVTLLMACGTTEVQPPDDEAIEGHFVGAVDERLFIAAVVVEHPSDDFQHAVMVYLCDGEDVSRWLVKETSSQTPVIEEGDVRVTLSLSDAEVSGEVDIVGEARPFTAVPANEDAGLFRMQRVGPPDYTGGWIILNNQEQRGALTENGTVIDNPILDAATGTAETSVGTFSDITRLPCIPVPGWGCIPLPH